MEGQEAKSLLYFLDSVTGVLLAFLNSPSRSFNLNNPLLSLHLLLVFSPPFPYLFLLGFPTWRFAFITHLIAQFLITGKRPHQKHSVTEKKKSTFHHLPASSM